MDQLLRKLGLLDATLIIIGIVIGSGIFLLPNVIARSLPSSGAILAVWIVAGILSSFGALAYAELGVLGDVNLAKHWLGLWGASVLQLQGDANGSPLTRDRTNWFANAGIAYRF